MPAAAARSKSVGIDWTSSGGASASRSAPAGCERQRSGLITPVPGSRKV
jgi:hypothetical protein